MSSSQEAVAPQQGMFGSEADKIRADYANIFADDAAQKLYLGRLATAMGNGISPNAVAPFQRGGTETSSTSNVEKTVKESGVGKGVIAGSLATLLGAGMLGGGMWLGTHLAPPDVLKGGGNPPIAEQLPGAHDKYEIESEVLPPKE